MIYFLTGVRLNDIRGLHFHTNRSATRLSIPNLQERIYTNSRASYFEIPIDEEENPGHEFIAIDNRKQGKYSIKVIPEPNALPTDTYSLEATIDGQAMTLACDIQIQNIPIQPYEVESKLNRSDFDADGDADAIDLSTLSLHWLAQDCDYPDWCEGTDLNYDNAIDLMDFALFADK